MQDPIWIRLVNATDFDDVSWSEIEGYTGPVTNYPAEFWNVPEGDFIWNGTAIVPRNPS